MNSRLSRAITAVAVSALTLGTAGTASAADLGDTGYQLVSSTSVLSYGASTTVKYTGAPTRAAVVWVDATAKFAGPMSKSGFGAATQQIPWSTFGDARGIHLVEVRTYPYAWTENTAAPRYSDPFDKSILITVLSHLSFTLPTLPTLVVGTPVSSVTFTLPDPSDVGWDLTNGVHVEVTGLPAGIAATVTNLDSDRPGWTVRGQAARVSLTGTPTTAGSSTAAWHVSDAASHDVSRTQPITVTNADGTGAGPDDTGTATAAAPASAGLAVRGGQWVVTWTASRQASGYRIRLGSTTIATVSGTATSWTAPAKITLTPASAVSVTALDASGATSAATPAKYTAGDVVPLASVLFAKNSSTLSPAGKAQLRALAKRITRDKYTNLSIVGFAATLLADPASSTADGASRLSLARAQAVAAYLKPLVSRKVRMALQGGGVLRSPSETLAIAAGNRVVRISGA